MGPVVELTAGFLHSRVGPQPLHPHRGRAAERTGGADMPAAWQDLARACHGHGGHCMQVPSPQLSGKQGWRPSSARRSREECRPRAAVGRPQLARKTQLAAGSGRMSQRGRRGLWLLDSLLRKVASVLPPGSFPALAQLLPCWVLPAPHPLRVHCSALWGGYWRNQSI